MASGRFAVGALRLVLGAVGLALACAGDEPREVFPGASWEQRAPAEVGLDPAPLRAVRSLLGGDGFISRYGYEVFGWGEPTRRHEIASASKPWCTAFLWMAVEQGLLANVDDKAVAYAPCLAEINAELGFPDREIRFRHLANQTSCYGVREAPGTAFSYNDWQTALFWDLLFGEVYGVPPMQVDRRVLRPLLTDRIGCQDAPTMLALHERVGPGRVAISPRDFARFGLLFLRQGEWDGETLLQPEHARRLVSSPLPNSIPRTRGEAAEMCPGQRSSALNRSLDKTDHLGSYSWMWWRNGRSRDGRRLWPNAPHDVYAALGSRNGARGMAVLPSQRIVIAWNRTRLAGLPDFQQARIDHPLGVVFKWLVEAAKRGEERD